MTKRITLERAREILGKRGKNMTDKDIQNLLIVLRILSDKVIDSVIAE